MNPTEAERIARSKVLAMLPTEGQASWTELETKAREIGMSLRTLRKNLDKCEKAGLVARIVDTQARPPRVYYRLKFRPIPAMAPSFFKNINKNIKDPLLREKAAETWLQFEEWMILTSITLLTREFLDKNFDENAFRIRVETDIYPLLLGRIVEDQSVKEILKPLLEKREAELKKLFVKILAKVRILEKDGLVAKDIKNALEEVEKNAF